MRGYTTENEIVAAKIFADAIACKVNKGEYSPLISTHVLDWGPFHNFSILCFLEEPEKKVSMRKISARIRAAFIDVGKESESSLAEGFRIVNEGIHCPDIVYEDPQLTMDEGKVFKRWSRPYISVDLLVLEC